MKKILSGIIRRPELVFIFIATFFGLLSVFTLPVLEAPDENLHFQVEYAIFSSDKQAPKDVVENESIVLSAVRDGSYKDYFNTKQAVKEDGFSFNTGSNVFDGKTKASVFDIKHLPQAIGVAIGRLIYPSLGTMVLTGRLFSLALYLVGMYFVIKKIKYGKWVIVAIATLPIMIQQAASLSYDPVNTLAIFAWFGFIVNLYYQKGSYTRKQIATGIILGALLLISKSNNVLLFLLLLTLPTTVFVNSATFKKIRNNKNWNITKYITLTLLVIVAAIGIYIIGQKLLAGQAFHPHQLLAVLLNTYLWGDLTLIDVVTTGMIGYFSNFYYHIPTWLVVLAFVVIFITMLHEKLPNVSRRFALISGGLFIGSIVIISIGMYYGWAIRPERLGPGASVTDGIQGRYFTPLLVLLFPVFAYLQKYIVITFKKARTIPVVITIMSVLLLTLYITQTINFFWS